jgi:branched-chain amino acid transport system ATP-binding protein
MLDLSNVEVFYINVIQVLKGVSLAVGDGKIVALLGANGGGKSTLLKAISGLLAVEEGRVTDGSIQFDGQRIENRDPTNIAKMGIVQVLEGRRQFVHLTVEENLLIGGCLNNDKGQVKKDLEMVYGYFPKIKLLRNQTVGYVSGGEQQMVVIGRALMARPKLMLLDEPSLGLGPLLVQEVFEIIRKINEEQKTSILLVDQNAVAALNLAEYGYVMENGRIVLDGPAEKLKSNEDIQEFYLGLSTAGSKKSYREIKHYRRRKRWL